MLKSQTGVLVGHIFESAAEEKIVFFENNRAISERSVGREDSVRGIGAWISREGLGKMPWHSSACTRVRYAITIPRGRGIVYPQRTENQWIRWNGKCMIEPWATNDATHNLSYDALSKAICKDMLKDGQRFWRRLQEGYYKCR